MLSTKTRAQIALSKLTPDMAMLIDIAAKEKASIEIEKHVKWLSSHVDKVLFKAMRENKISEERAKKILDRAGEIINEV